EVAIFTGSTFAMGLIGASEVAAHAIALQIAAASFMAPLGLSQAATVRVGLFFGARDRAGIGRAGRASLWLAIGYMAAAAALMLAAPEFFAAIFLDRNDPANAPVLALATTFLLFAALF